jgi:hypothetical protein
MASGTRGSSVPRFSTTGRATSLQHVLKNVLQCDLTSPLYLSVLQHFGGDEDKFNIIDYFLCNQTYFENLSYSETVIENPKEKDPAKVITRVERYHVPNYLRARCIFFKKFLEDKKNNGEDLNYESFYMGLTLDSFMAWKAEEMTMNTPSPRVAKSRDLVADFKKGIKQDPSLFPSLKHIDNWPTFKCETMAQAFAQDVVNIFNPKYKPRGSEEKDLFTLQLYYVYAIFCSNLKTDFRQNWFGTTSHRKMHRRSGKSYPMMQKSLWLPNSMQLIYYSTLIQPKWRTGKALCFHSSTITKSRFGYMTSYNPLTSRPPTMQR